jgi:taurine dioxygenase
MFEVKPIRESDGIGCEVHGLKAEQLDEQAVRKALRELWLKEGLVVFRNLHGPETHMRLSRCFGDPQPHPVGRLNANKVHRELVEIRFDPKNGDLYEIDNQILGSWLPWHADLIYMVSINHGGILRPIVVPKRGGETGFMDRMRLYESLDESLKARIEGLSVVYRLDIDPSKQKFGVGCAVRMIRVSPNRADIMRRQDQYPAVVHPLVFRHPDTGRKTLNFSPWFSERVVGLPQKESDELLTELGRICSGKSFAYYHKWQEGDMVLWDNWRMLHSAKGVPVDEERLLERSTIHGDYGFGRLASELESDAGLEVIDV